METAGLVVGSVALIGLFESCVTLMSQIGLAKSMAQDYGRLETKLDFQKFFLLQWADRVNLVNESYDRRLDNEVIKKAVERCLICIRDLLSNSSELQRRYGIRPSRPDDAATSLPGLSDRLMDRFRNNSTQVLPIRSATHAHKRHKLLSTDGGSNEYTIKEKIRWVIKDKEAFECLIRELSDLVTNLDKILPAENSSAVSWATLSDEVRTTHNANLSRSILHTSTDTAKLTNKAEKVLSYERSQNILDRLWFRLIDDRERSVSENHFETLKWAIRPPSSPAKWDDLSKWLRQRDGVYWIYGKPGSGKSTLMKFLSKNADVHSMLQEWTGIRKLNIASFFLWNIGSAEQNTQQGLARGLLYHVLEKNRSLIPIVLPEMWVEARIVEKSDQLALPSSSELDEAFQRLGSVSTNGSYMFFIDGLDEFAGDHRRGIDFVKKLTKIPNIKLVLSSRPIDTCVAAFSSQPKLRLQDLTENDIRMYTEDTLRAHPYVAEGIIITQPVLEHFVEDVQKKASGVFLWVVLACRALITGFDALCSLEELQEQLDALPPELEELFRHILKKIPPSMRPQAAKILQVCWRGQSMELSNELGTGIDPIALAWADQKRFKALYQFDAFSRLEQERWCRILEGRLRSQCMGLLEIHHFDFPRSDDKVTFMHRTVFDFLNNSSVWSLDCLQIADGDFDATTTLFYISAYSLYTQEESIFRSQRFFTRCRFFLEEIDETAPSNVPNLLQCLALALVQPQHTKHPRRLVRQLLSRDTEENLEYFFGPQQQHQSLEYAALILAVEYDFINGLRKGDIGRFTNSEAPHTNDRSTMHPLLYHALYHPLLQRLSDTIDLGTFLNTEIVRVLLDFGCSPNEEFEFPEPGGRKTTVWEFWLEQQPTFYAEEFWMFDSAERIAEVTLLMIQAGAGPQRAESTVNPRESYKKWESSLRSKMRRWSDEEDVNLDGIKRPRLEKFKEFCRAIVEKLPGEDYGARI